MWRWIWILLLGPGWLEAQKVTQSSFSLTASETQCSVGKAVDQVGSGERQVFFWFLLTGGAGLPSMTVEWLDPSGQVAQFASYERLPAGASLCFLNQMPVAGFEAAAKPGRWTARVVAGGRVVLEKQFTLKGDAAEARGLRVRSVSRVETAGGSTDIVVEGSGISQESMVHLAVYSLANAWQFLASLPAGAGPAGAAEGGRVSIRYPARLSPGEYWVIVKNLDGAQSAPVRLLVSTDRGYVLPIAAGEQWIITQGPYGGTSHWGKSLHAWDIAPLSLRTGGCVTAMRDGIVHAFDRREVQNSRGRSFGNYITIQHDDGEFSHYAHLRSGTFVVRTGQRVVAGQALAMVGNSGHTLGAGGGYHVHAHVTSSFAAGSPSIPFTYSGMGNVAKGKVVSNPTPLTGSCGVAYDGPLEVSRVKKPDSVREPAWTASVGLEEWWQQSVSVPAGAKALDLSVVSKKAAEEKVDVYLISPSGMQYGGPFADAKQTRVERPEAGAWWIRIQGVKGSGVPINFEVWGGVVR